MLWEKLDGVAKEYFDSYKDLEQIKPHHLDALARGCIAAAKLDGMSYKVGRYDKKGETRRRTPEAREAQLLRQEVDNMNRTFGLTPLDQSKIMKTDTGRAKEKRLTKVPLRKVSKNV